MSRVPDLCEAVTVSGWNRERRSFSGNSPCQFKARTERGGKKLCMRHAGSFDLASLRRETLTALVESKWPKFAPGQSAQVFVNPQELGQLVDLLYPYFRMAKNP